MLEENQVLNLISYLNGKSIVALYRRVHSILCHSPLSRALESDTRGANRSDRIPCIIIAQLLGHVNTPVSVFSDEPHVEHAMAAEAVKNSSAE